VDSTFREVLFVVWTQVELHLSIISATIPVLRPVVNNLNTSYSSLGPIVSSTGYGGSSGAFKLSTLQPQLSITDRSYAASRSSKIIGQTSNADTGTSAFAYKNDQIRTIKRRASPETGSIESHGSEQMIIRKQISWRVEHDASEGRRDEG
jgi:hypothetical protein